MPRLAQLRAYGKQYIHRRLPGRHRLPPQTSFEAAEVVPDAGLVKMLLLKWVAEEMHPMDFMEEKKRLVAQRGDTSTHFIVYNTIYKVILIS